MCLARRVSLELILAGFSLQGMAPPSKLDAGSLLARRRWRHAEGREKHVTWFTAFDPAKYYVGDMSSIMTRAELVEIVADLRAMAAGEPTATVRDALSRLVDRYSALNSRDRRAPAVQPVVWPMVF